MQRQQEEQIFLDMLPDLPDLQCAWALLLNCAVPRCNHFIRSLPPSVARGYADGHDHTIQTCFQALLGLAGELDGPEAARISQLSSLPLGLGGGGLRSATRTCTSAYWASWADALPMLRQRVPAHAWAVLQRLLGNDVFPAACLEEVRQCAQDLRDSGVVLPSWEDIWNGQKPQPPDEDDHEPGQWKHGWQYYASTQIETHFRGSVVLPSMSATARSLLRSQSGCCSGRHLTLSPVSPESTYSNEKFRALLLRRMRLPLQVAASRCNGNSCRACLDALGDHRAACSLAGRLVLRSSPVERMWARVCREGGARVQTNVFLRDLNLRGVEAQDGRRIEVIANGLPLYHGAQIAIDATIVSPVRADGLPIARSDENDGVALRNARAVKFRKYRDLVQGRRCRLLVAGVETGGRWDKEAHRFLVQLARPRRELPPQSSAQLWLMLGSDGGVA